MNPSTLAPQPAGDLRLLRDAWIAAVHAQGRSLRSLEHWVNETTRFILWCEARGVVNAMEVSKPILERYQRHLFYYRKPPGKDGTGGGQPLAMRTQYHRLTCLRQWFKWLTKKDHLPANPASDLDMPKIPVTVPKDIFTPEEVEKVLGFPDITDTLGLRDRAILEVIYATGIRRMEACRLGIYDLDAGRGVVQVREGKGQKDRVLPITKRALEWVERYLVESRPKLATGALAPMGKKRGPKAGHAGTRARRGMVMQAIGDDRMGRHWGIDLPRGASAKDVLFLTRHGEPFDVDALGTLVRSYIEKAEIPGKGGACHVFRHSMATGMLNNGADIRFVQAMLGHASLETTQIYTRVSVEKLRQVCEATHPSRPAAATESASGEAQVAPD